jgi:predicted adenylyl cyclase CyaB
MIKKHLLKVSARVERKQTLNNNTTSNQQEIEVKIIDINKEAMLAKLTSLGAVRIKEVFQKDYYFSIEWQKPKRTIRLRIEDKQSFVTIKKNSSNDNGIRTRDEYEVPVDNPSQIREIFLAMGLMQKQYYETKRIYFQLQDCSVELVTRPTIPTYMEIEGERQAILRVTQLLGFTENDFLIESFQKKYPQSQQDLRFEDE